MPCPMPYWKIILLCIDQLCNGILLHGWPDESLSSHCYRWRNLEKNRLIADVFYDGAINSLEDFKKEMAIAGILPFAIYWQGEMAAFSWLNQIRDKTARTHFAIFRKWHGRKRRPPLGRATYIHILHMREGGGFLFDCLYGITPATHRLAIKAALSCGWVKCGEYPKPVMWQRKAGALTA